MARKKADTYDLALEGHKPFKPRNRNQEIYHRSMRNSDMVIGIGPAGSGKTYVASAWAAEQLASGMVETVILTRPIVTVENEQIGFLPGKLENKMEPWTAPIFDVFYERIGVQRTQEFLKGQKIRIVPFGFMRGRTFKDCIVLVDEAQNMTPTQAKALVTRAGEGATYVIDGDLEQTDLKGPNGLDMLIDMVERFDLPVPIVTFTKKDVVRSEMCRLWVEAFESM